MVTDALERYRSVRDSAWQWRYELSWIKKLTLAIGIAVLIGLSAQVRMPLPWTPVPITGQTFAVLLAAVLLGQGWGGVSAAIYVGLGMAGVPWFNGWSGGLAVIAGPTGGYLIGFILAALFLGYLVDRYIRVRSFFSLLGIMLLADFILVFGPGLIQLHLWTSLAGKGTIGFYQLISMGLLPFIGGEVVKVIAAAGAAWVLSSKKESR
jgi:biotin transport system substrate-specific component